MNTRDQVAELIDIMLDGATRCGENAGMTPAEIFGLFVRRAAEKNIQRHGYAATYAVLRDVARDGIQGAAEELAARSH